MIPRSGIAAAIAAMSMGIGLARPSNDEWRNQKPKAKSATKNRSKVKAARKQKAKP